MRARGVAAALALLLLPSCGTLDSASGYGSDLDPPPGSSDSCPQWSLDGSLVGFTRFGLERGVVVAPARGTKARSLPSTRAGDEFVGWLADPTRVAVARGRELLAVPVTGRGGATPFLRLRRAETVVSMSPDGRFVAVEGVDESRGEPRSVLRAVRVRDAVRIDLADGFVSGGRFSARAPRVAFVADDSVVVVDLDSGERAEIGPGYLGDTPSLTSDGRQVAFARAGSDFVNRIYSATLGPGLRAGPAMFLTGDGDAENTEPVFTPDGAAVLYQHGGDLRSFDLAEQSDERLTDAGGTGDYCPAVSPDGQRVAFMREVGGALSSSSAVIVMDDDGGSKHLLRTSDASG